MYGQHFQQSTWYGLTAHGCQSCLWSAKQENMSSSVSPFVPENLISRDRFGRIAPRQPDHSLHSFSTPRRVVVHRAQSKLLRALYAHRRRSSCRTSKPGQHDNEESYDKFLGRAREELHGICRMPGGLTRRHDEGFSGEGDLRQKSGIA